MCREHALTFSHENHNIILHLIILTPTHFLWEQGRKQKRTGNIRHYRACQNSQRHSGKPGNTGPWNPSYQRAVCSLVARNGVGHAFDFFHHQYASRNWFLWCYLQYTKQKGAGNDHWWRRWKKGTMQWAPTGCPAPWNMTKKAPGAAPRPQPSMY